jgi:hypothetical protein
MGLVKLKMSPRMLLGSRREVRSQVKLLILKLETWGDPENHVVSEQKLLWEPMLG